MTVRDRQEYGIGYGPRRPADKFGVASLFQSENGRESINGGGHGSASMRSAYASDVPASQAGRNGSFYTGSPGVNAYRPDAYRDAPHVTHGTEVRFAMRPSLYYGLIGGSGFVALTLFFAGFLAAYLLFNDQGYPVAQSSTAGSNIIGSNITGSNTTGRGQTVAPARPALQPVQSAPSSQSGIARPAQAIVPENSVRIPAPEIAAALEAQQRTVREVDPAVFEPTEDPGVFPDLAPRARLKPAPPVALTDAAETETNRIPRVTLDAVAPDPVDLTQSEPTVAPTPVATRVIRGDVPYSLQFGAFGRRSNAERMVRRLSGVLSDARIEEGTGADGQALHYVRAGAFNDRIVAERALAKLRRDAGLIGIVYSGLLEG